LTEMQSVQVPCGRGAGSGGGAARASTIVLGVIADLVRRWVRIQAELRSPRAQPFRSTYGKWTSLNRRILKFRKLQATYQPGSIVALRTRNTPPKELAEDVPLMLPSALTEAQCAGAPGVHGGLGGNREDHGEAQCRGCSFA
ncbi:hypothetical protein DFH07DRAFT_784158, partial [Mycena maculata]